MPPLRLTTALFLAGLPVLAACDLDYPKVSVVNMLGDSIVIRNPSFNGCVWSTVLGDGDATSPDRCLPGADRVHFQKLDVVEEAAAGANPVWFNYQTVSAKHVKYGQFHVFEVTLDDIEQDFSVPGPYGH